MSPSFNSADLRYTWAKMRDPAMAAIRHAHLIIEPIERHHMANCGNQISGSSFVAQASGDVERRCRQCLRSASNLQGRITNP